jgi:MFS family permease
VVRGGFKSPSDRVGVTAAFLIHATVSGTWAPRLPAIKSSLALSNSVLGLALVGLAVGLLAGFALLGAGLAPAVPIAFSAAGAIDPKTAGRNIARVATIGYVGSVSRPIMIGWLAEATSLRLALGLTAILALVVSAAAKTLDPRRQRTSRTTAAVPEAA